MSRLSYIGLKANDMGYDAHLTVTYLGRLDEWRDADLIQRIKSALHTIGTVAYVVERDNIKLFRHETPVLTVKPVHGDLYELPKRLADEFGVQSKSEFDFNPHISLKTYHNNVIHIPKFITLDRLNLY